MEILEKSNVDAIWGKVIVPLPPDPTDSEVNTSGLEKGEFVTANCFCRKTVLRRINGFDERFYKAWREDSDLYFTLIEQKANVRFIPHCIVYHPARPSRFGISIPMQKNNLFEPLLFSKHTQLYRRNIHFPIVKRFYVIVFFLILTIILSLLRRPDLAIMSFALWSVLTLSFIRLRLLHSSRDLKHIIEMALTSILIPPLAVYWRIVGAFRFKVLFL